MSERTSMLDTCPIALTASRDIGSRDDTVSKQSASDYLKIDILLNISYL
jgi:hypothetical protein